jgi:hypothetical protein
VRAGVSIVNSQLMTKILCCQVASMLLLGAKSGTYTGLELRRIDLNLLKFVAVILFASYSITITCPMPVYQIMVRLGSHIGP